jgi:hypothetical protein
MTWHVLPSIGLIVAGVAGMGALQMGVHKLFHGKVLTRHLLFALHIGKMYMLLTLLVRRRRIPWMTFNVLRFRCMIL